jgi:hypothetical protein
LERRFPGFADAIRKAGDCIPIVGANANTCENELPVTWKAALVIGPLQTPIQGAVAQVVEEARRGWILKTRGLAQRRVLAVDQAFNQRRRRARVRNAFFKTVEASDTLETFVDPRKASDALNHGIASLGCGPDFVGGRRHVKVARQLRIG